MKIIDLLNKIANGEEVPKEIKFNGFIWNYDINNKRYCRGENLLFNVLGHYKGIILNGEVEIIEENNTIKKIKSLNNVGGCNYLLEFEDKQQLNNHILKDKINELVDEINKLKGE